eukprot:TRINITY_DN42226_c0_g1_i3.p1 TRINITY_DN42226_c0_g1~~TRINITY_DN42226_c0_g1_i3.p1  ORF type:complete len:234 (-),score=32.94 TRINITY_DN42226_c0_g1_i3:80-706(-)
MAQPAEPRRRMRALIVCAMAEEANNVAAQLHRMDEDGIHLDYIICGVGVVDAAINTAVYFAEKGTESRPDIVLSVGCAGGHLEDMLPGDVVLGTAAVPTGYRMIRQDGTEQHVGFRDSTQPDASQPELAADPDLLSAARTAAAAAELPCWPRTDQRPRTFEGKVASSDTWVQRKEEIRRLRSTLGTACEEMESVAVVRWFAVSQSGES